jgi:hypothetical protein
MNIPSWLIDDRAIPPATRSAGYSKKSLQDWDLGVLKRLNAIARTSSRGWLSSGVGRNISRNGLRQQLSIQDLGFGAKPIDQLFP